VSPRLLHAGGTPALPGCAPSWERGQRALGDATRAGRPRSQGVRRRGSASSVPSETRRERDARAPRVCAVVEARAVSLTGVGF